VVHPSKIDMGMIYGESREAASDEHQALVKALMDKFVNDGLSIEKAAYAGYEEPYTVGRHEPDIIARDSSTELLYIGEAKLCADLSSERTQEQFEDFATKFMSRGRSQNASVPFHIIAPTSCAQAVWTILGQLGLDRRANIRVWHFGD
jgi:hypothetical protein